MNSSNESFEDDLKLKRSRRALRAGRAAWPVAPQAAIIGRARHRARIIESYTFGIASFNIERPRDARSRAKFAQMAKHRPHRQSKRRA
ncbi:hypothetical protein [Burkholderia pseudomallei]|nr:hypothetical protein [Burkholderia pseudomallei]